MRSRHLLASIAFAAAGLSLAQTIPHDPAAFTEYVATKLRAEAGDASVVVKAPLTLGLGELQANLDRIFVFCRSGSSACPDEVDRYVKGVVETYKERTSPPSKA